MSYHHHHQCHCHSTPPTPTCFCTTCYTTTTHYPSPPPPNPLLPYPQTHLHAPPQTHPHTLHAPPQTHLHTPPQNNLHPPPQAHLFQENQKLSINDPTVSSLIRRISALETSLRRRTKHSLRDAAARTIQTHFRAFLVRRSTTLRHLKDLAFIKASLNKLKSSVSNKPHFDSYSISRQSLNLLIKLDSIQGSDSMIRDGKRSITRELIKFMDLIDEICMESQLISVKNVRFNNKNGVVLQREKKIRVSSENEKKISEILKHRIEMKNRIEGLLKSQPKTKKNVSFDENGNVYRLIERKNSHASSSDGSEDVEEEVEEIGVSSKETEVEVDNEEEESLEMSENEMDPRKNLQTRIDDLTKKIQLGQECHDEEEDDDDDDEDDSFVFSAPLPAKMEYRVDSTSKKQTAKQ